MARRAHQRRDFRGPFTPDGRRQQLAYQVAKVARPTRLAQRILATWVCHGRGLYEIRSDLVSEWRMAVEDALPFVNDLEGEVWR